MLEDWLEYASIGISAIVLIFAISLFVVLGIAAMIALGWWTFLVLGIIAFVPLFGYIISNVMDYYLDDDYDDYDHEDIW